jgi:hypothetical protein
MDCRFHLTVKFHIYGKDYDWDTSLNWSGDDGEIDQRITDFFLNSYEDALAEYRQRNWERETEQREKREREHELSELKRLREKYPDA